MLFHTEKSSESIPAVQQKGTKRGIEETAKQTKKVHWNDENAEESSSEESDSSLDSEEETTENKAKQQQTKSDNSKQNDFQVVPVEDNSKGKQREILFYRSMRKIKCDHF